MIKKLLIDALTQFFKSEKGEELIGNIMLKAIKQSFLKEMHFEDGKSEPGKVVEKTQTVDVLDQILFYLPHLEGAIRGCQVDTVKSTRKVIEGLHKVIESNLIIGQAMNESIQIEPSEELKQIAEDMNENSRNNSNGGIGAGNTRCIEN